MESFNNFNGFVSENRQIKSFYLAEKTQKTSSVVTSSY